MDRRALGILKMDSYVDMTGQRDEHINSNTTNTSGVLYVFEVT